MTLAIVKNINKYTNSNKRSTFQTVILSLGLIIICIVFIIIISKIKYNINKESFAGCDSDAGDLPGRCMNYSGCCSSINGMNSCICNHPLLQKCQSDYNDCIKDTTFQQLYTPLQIEKLCKGQNAVCCNSYNNISITTSNFTGPSNFSQNDNIICSIPGAKDIENKCAEICQTNPSCAAYSINKSSLPYSSCSLFSSVSMPENSVFLGNPNSSSQSLYYVKNIPTTPASA